MPLHAPHGVERPMLLLGAAAAADWTPDCRHNTRPPSCLDRALPPADGCWRLLAEAAATVPCRGSRCGKKVCEGRRSLIAKTKEKVMLTTAKDHRIEGAEREAQQGKHHTTRSRAPIADRLRSGKTTPSRAVLRPNARRSTAHQAGAGQVPKERERRWQSFPLSAPSRGCRRAALPRLGISRLSLTRLRDGACSRRSNQIRLLASRAACATYIHGNCRGLPWIADPLFPSFRPRPAHFNRACARRSSIDRRGFSRLRCLAAHEQRVSVRAIASAGPRSMGHPIGAWDLGDGRWKGNGLRHNCAG